MTSPFRSDLFAGKRVLVTGAARGIGKAVARGFWKAVLSCSSTPAGSRSRATNSWPGFRKKPQRGSR